MLHSWNQKFQGLLARFHRDERGTSMTEFVALTPVFITIFAGTLQLSKLQHTGIEVQITATKTLWGEALPVTKSLMAKPVHMTPASASVHALSQVRNRGQSWASVAQDVARYGKLGVNGTVGEAWALTKLPKQSGLVDYEDPKSSLDDVVDKNKGFTAHQIVDDALSVPSGSGNLAQVFNSLLSAVGARPAIAAGIRYGQVSGLAQKSVSIAGRSVNTEAGFDVLVAPYPHNGFRDHALTVGTVRLTIEGNDSVRTILGIHSGNSGRWKKRR